MYHKKVKRDVKVIVCVVLTILLTLGFIGCAKPADPKATPTTPTAPTTPAQEKAPDSGEVFNLSLAHFQPATHEVETVLIQGWIERIKEETNGRVIITSFPGGTLIPGREIYEGVVDGVADIGHTAYAYTRGRFPVIETLLVPGLNWQSALVADRTVMELIEVLQPQEIADVKHLFSFTTGRGDLLTQAPIKRMEDLRGLEIGVTAGERADALRMLGSTGVVLPMPEHYEAIQRGLTKGVIAPMETLKSFRIAEVVNYVTHTPMLYNQILNMVMNLDTWNSLPPDIQQTIDRVTKEYYDEVIAGFYDWLEELVHEWLAKEGFNLEITILSPEEEQRWIKQIEPMFDDHVKYLNEKGLPGKDILNTVVELNKKNLDKYGK